MNIREALNTIEKETNTIEDLKQENTELKRLIQDFLDYGNFQHFQKKNLWKAGFKVKFPKTYKWMEEYNKQNGKKKQ